MTKSDKINSQAIIATKDRVESCKELVRQLLNLKFFDSLIVIDSSEKNNSEEFESPKVNYFQCPVKNQPFQRYLGYRLSNAEVLFFFDDDVRITNSSEFLSLIKVYDNHRVVGAGFDLELHRNNPGSSDVKRRVNPIITLFKKLKKGEYWISGIKAEMPSKTSNVEYLKGPAFSARRSALYKNFNFQLFSLYDKKIGKGEDAIISYTLSKQGLVLFNPIKPLVHLDTMPSNYSLTASSFYKKYAFSRFYHTSEYIRLSHKDFWFSVFAYSFYYLFLVSSMLSSLFRGIFSFSRKAIIRSMGIAQGLILTLFIPILLPSAKKSKLFWQEKADSLIKYAASNKNKD